VAGFKLLSIKDFSKLTGISTARLRYYDNIGLFLPARKSDTGYRYYVPSQLISINMINVMSDIGISLDDITKAAMHRTPQTVSEIFSNYEEILKDKIRELSKSYDVLNTYRKLIDLGNTVKKNEVFIDYRNEVKISVGKDIDFGNDTSYYTGFVGFLASAEENGIDLSYPIGGYFNDFESFSNMPNRPDKFYSYDPNGKDSIPAGNYMSYYANCDYSDVSLAPNILTEYATKNGYECIGPVYNLWIQDEVSVPNPLDYLVEIRVAVRKK
jgi:DNA-binding transcriptional MerR regulator